ncbi:MAG: hypothetical protein K2V38_29370, partial [Gemmataceae bacterium]|nr:hypothetical protein [Gemmataceae bacterium]
MSHALASWPRPHFAPGGGEPLLYFVAFGEFDLSKPLSASKYHSRGPGDWLAVNQITRDAHAPAFERHQSNPFWEHIRRDAPAAIEEAERAPQAIELRGAVSDPDTLDYFRDAVGVLAWLLDCGGVSIYDPQRVWLWSADEWREEVFAPGSPQPHLHTVILVSEDGPGRTWMHTRGMRQYGRPDLSVRGVGESHLDAVTELLDRFINLQALGGLITDG